MDNIITHGRSYAQGYHGDSEDIRMRAGELGAGSLLTHQ